MAQVKKTSVRDAILDSATELFTERGYSNTTLADISRKASVTMSNYLVQLLELMRSGMNLLMI